MKPENAALVEAKLNATGVRIVNALYADETMDTLMDAAREEGRQSAGERVKALEGAVLQALPIVEDRARGGRMVTSLHYANHVSAELRAPLSSTAGQDNG